MYLRTTPRKNKDGSVVRYLQLAHNTWDPVAKRSRAQVIYNFGREDTANRAALTRLIASVTRFLGLDAVMRRLLKGRRRDEAAERVLFALVANRALAPSSKLAASRWACEDVQIAGLPATSDDACYRAMDWLLEIQAALEKEVFHQVANLLNLEVDLLF